MTVPLPTPIRTAVGNCNRQVTLIVGAGCSFEPPTEIPLARELALEAHRRLVDDGVISDTACADPESLSAVAKAVIEEQGDQSALVSILPREDFRFAEPNRGYLNAAALLREGVIADVVTLNFDLALQSAVVQVGGREDITVIPGPERHADLGQANVIFLHRNVECRDLEDWILTEDALAEAWGNDRWETVILQRCASTPVVIFAGLGSRADVLEGAMKDLRSALGNDVYLVDPSPPGESDLFEALELEDHQHVRAGWVAFMDAVADRLAMDQRRAHLQACQDQAEAEGWDQPSAERLSNLLGTRSLLNLGQMRADLTLDSRNYRVADPTVFAWIGDLLLVVDRIAETLQCTVTFSGPGLLAFVAHDGTYFGVLGFASGRGVRSRLSIEPVIKGFRSTRDVTKTPAIYIVGGVTNWETDGSTPSDLVAEPSADSIVSSPSVEELVHGADVLSGARSVESLFG